MPSVMSHPSTWGVEEDKCILGSTMFQVLGKAFNAGKHPPYTYGTHCFTDKETDAQKIYVVGLMCHTIWWDRSTARTDSANGLTESSNTY